MQIAKFSLGPHKGANGWESPLGSLLKEKIIPFGLPEWSSGKQSACYFTLVRIAAIKKSTKNKCKRGCGEKGTLLHCWWECKLGQPLWRTVWRFLKKLEIELPYDPAIPLLGIHTEETRIERDTCTPVFITALFTIARTWKQPRCPLADEWIRKLWYIYTMKSVLIRWMKLEPIIRSEVSQKEKHQYSMLTHIYGI